jgi:hypothetical protein
MTGVVVAVELQAADIAQQAALSSLRVGTTVDVTVRTKQNQRNYYKVQHIMGMVRRAP